MLRSRFIAALPLLLTAACSAPAGEPAPSGEAAAPNRSNPSNVGPADSLTDVIQVDAAPAVTCALTSGGGVYCWGQLSDVALPGRSPAPLFGVAATAPVRIPGPPAVRITVSERRVAMLDEAGSLFVAGAFDSGWPSTDTFRPAGATDVRVVFKSPGPSAPLCWLTDANAMECNTGERNVLPAGLLVDGRAPGCVATTDSMQCTRGSPSHLVSGGVVGDPALCVTDTEPQLRGKRAYRFSTAGRPRALYASGDGACALTEDGATRCVERRIQAERCVYGRDTQCERTSSTRSSVEYPGPFTDLATGPRGTPLRYGLTPEGTVTDLATSTAVLSNAGVTALAASFDHTCALRADGKVACWGANDVGQLGDGSLAEGRAPNLVVAPRQAQQRGGPPVTFRADSRTWTKRGRGDDASDAELCPLVKPDRP